MTPKALLIIISLLVSVLLSTVVFAQGEVPPPYAGLKNPFPWDDPSAQSAGKGVYQRYCLGCHGITGSGLAGSDFSARDYPQRLESRPDFYYWIVSEGRMDIGMPSFKASLSEQQRWEVLTYVWSLGKASTTPVPPGPPEAGALQLNAVKQTEGGQPLVMSARLLDQAGRPISGVAVAFSTRENFFTTGLMTIGDAVTDEQGVATLEYVPRRAGTTELIATYGDIRASATTIVTETDIQFYQAEAGIRLPAAGPKVFLGPLTASEPTEGQAPTTALRLPGGLFSWLWLVVIALALIWSTYFKVMYQVLHIAREQPPVGQDLSLVPRIALVIVLLLGILMVLMIITGPYSHFHLIPY